MCFPFFKPENIFSIPQALKYHLCISHGQLFDPCREQNSLPANTVTKGVSVLSTLAMMHALNASVEVFRELSRFEIQKSKYFEDCKILIINLVG